VRHAERGFTLVEVLVAAAAFAGVGFAALETVRVLAAGTAQLAARHLAESALERLGAELRAEARTATAIRIAANAPGAAHDGCVQLDLFTADAGGPRFWSYRQFPNHVAGDAIPPDVLQRLAAAAPIAACDASSAGSVVLSGLQGAATLTAVAPAGLGAHDDPYLGTPDAPFVASGVPATPPFSLGVLDATGQPISGRNTLVGVRIDTAFASRAFELLPGAMPNGYTQVLRYTCSERCDVGHDTAAPKTLTRCAMSWQTAWSELVLWNDATTNADGSLSFPSGWFFAGTFTFTYAGTRASDGGTDTLVKPYVATNWDAARDYAAFPPDKPAANGTSAGSFAPWDVRNEAPAAWLADAAPYLATGEAAGIVAEQQRCDAVQAEGDANAFYTNG